MAKELCMHFAHPTKVGVDALKRAARFLVGLPRLVWHFPFQEYTKDLKVYVDTDFGGCQTTRRSTSGGVAMRGRHPVKHWSVTLFAFWLPHVFRLCVFELMHPCIRPCVH